MSSLGGQPPRATEVITHADVGRRTSRPCTSTARRPSAAFFSTRIRRRYTTQTAQRLQPSKRTGCTRWPCEWARHTQPHQPPRSSSSSLADCRRAWHARPSGIGDALVESSRVKSSQVKSSRVKSSPDKSSRVKSGRAEPRQVESNHVESSRGKATARIGRLDVELGVDVPCGLGDGGGRRAAGRRVNVLHGATRRRHIWTRARIGWSASSAAQHSEHRRSICGRAERTVD